MIKKGRSVGNVIRLSDVSVSRFHCYIRKIGKELHIYNMHSKFGTLLYVKNREDVDLSKGMEFVSENTLVQAEIKDRTSFFSFLNFDVCQACRPREEEDEEEEELEFEKDRSTDSTEAFLLCIKEVEGEDS